MSSYMNFYLVPRTEDKKPMRFFSVSRNNELYSTINESASIPFIGVGEEPVTTELTESMILGVLSDVKKELANAENNLSLRMEAYKQLSAKVSDDSVSDYVSTKTYIEELKETIHKLELLEWIVSDLEYTDFEKVLVNTD